MIMTTKAPLNTKKNYNIIMTLEIQVLDWDIHKKYGWVKPVNGIPNFPNIWLRVNYVFWLANI
jgi:hypothetical protein